MEISAIQNAWNWNCSELEKCTLPSMQVLTLKEKVSTYSVQFFKGAFFTLILPMTYVVSKAASLFHFESEKSGMVRCLPSDFEIGVATAEFQVNGAKNHPNCSWAKWESTQTEDGKLHILNGDRSGVSLDHWNHPERVISRLKELGIHHYRFSLERSMIEPAEGQFDEVAIQHYINFCEQLKENGIEPFITLHHFSDPNWFLDKGGFENEENIPGFVRYCEEVFKRFDGKVKKWATFNEPGVYTTQGYVRGVYPPGKTELDTAGKVLKNVLMAHCKVYESLKEMDHGRSSMIGITHNILRFRPYSFWNPVEKLTCHYLTKIFHETTMQFLKTGEFSFQIPFKANVQAKIDGPAPMDFIGVQYYGDPLLRITPFSAESTCYPDETMTNFHQRFYPQGLKTALQEAQELKKPIYITETGIDADDSKRVEYFQKVFQIASKAIQQGCDLRGLYIWTLEDNFEWDMGWNIHLGLYSHDPKTGEVQSRKVAHFIQGFLSSHQREAC